MNRKLVAVAAGSATAMALVAAAVAFGFAPSGTQAPAVPLLFRGDFESGNLSQWSGGLQCANTGVATDADVARGTVGVSARLAGQGRFSVRFNLPVAATRNACELLSERRIGIGTDDYYGLMVYFPKDWTEPSPAGWGVSVAQLNFEDIWGPPLMIAAHANRIALVLQSGACVVVTGCQYSSGPGGNLRQMLIVPKLQLGVWHELIVHVRWATDSSGVVEAWHRVKGTIPWTKTVSLAGHPTVQWDADRLPALSSDGTVDKIGAYRGASEAPLHYWADDFTRARSFAAVAASLP